MKTQLISARFGIDEARTLEEIANEEKTDKTTALRKIFNMGTKQYNLESAIRKYAAGKISTGKAAEVAGVSLWEIMDELKARNITNPMTKEEHIEGLKNLEKILRQ